MNAADTDSPLPERPIRVLYVEDDPASVDLVIAVLDARAEVASLDRGRDVVETAARDRPDMVLLDLRLPDMDGITILRALRADGRTSDIPVVMVTGETDPRRLDEARALGVAGVLTKPWRAAQLDALVMAVCRP